MSSLINNVQFLASATALTLCAYVYGGAWAAIATISACFLLESLFFAARQK